MKYMDLQKIVHEHSLWLDDCGGIRADLYGADLSGADLYRADLSGADLSDVDLRSADLSGANLRGANLYRADLSDVDLRRADLSGADLYGANLSQTKGLTQMIAFMAAHFERTTDGYIAYKTFGSQYPSPECWEIKTGSIIKETVLFDRCCAVGCGINVAPIEWVKKNYDGHIWKVLIRWEWLCGVCAPYSSDGKIRCERVELIEIVK